MENVLDIGRVPYLASDKRIDLTIKETLILYCSTCFDAFKLIIWFVPFFLYSVCSWMFNCKRKEIRDQLAVVTGGANGIGKQIAICLAQARCNVVIADIDAVEGHKTAALIAGTLKVRAKYYQVNVAVADSVAKLKANVEHEMGPVDIVVNCAGLIPVLSLMEKSNDQVDFIIDTNVKSAIWTTRAFLDGMIERRCGHILTISSMTAVHPLPNAVLYGATKIFQKGFMDGLREKLRQEGHSDYINLTTIYPYFVNTRKDLIDALDLRYPPLSAEKVAHLSVDAILRNQNAVYYPHAVMLVKNIAAMFPLIINQFIRDVIFRESRTKKAFKNASTEKN